MEPLRVPVNGVNLLKLKSVVINCYIQAAIMALYKAKIESIATLDAVLVLNKLGDNNQVLIIWIQAHSGYWG